MLAPDIVPVRFRDCTDGHLPYLRAGLEPLRRFPWVGDVRVIGGVGIVELELSEAGYLDSLGPRLYRAFLDRGLLLRPLGHVVYFVPPYAITESQAAWALDRIGEAIEEAKPQ